MCSDDGRESQDDIRKFARDFYFHQVKYGEDLVRRRDSYLKFYVGLNLAVLAALGGGLGVEVGGEVVKFGPSLILLLSLVGVALNLIWFKVSESLKESSVVSYAVVAALENFFPAELTPYRFNQLNARDNYARGFNHYLVVDGDIQCLKWQNRPKRRWLPLRIAVAPFGLCGRTPSGIALAFPAIFFLGFCGASIWTLVGFLCSQG